MILPQQARRGYHDPPYLLLYFRNGTLGAVRLGVMVAAIGAADVSVGCIRMPGPVKRLRIVHGVHGGDPRASRSALTSDGAARVGRRCGPPWAITARRLMQRDFRQRRGGGAGKVP